MGITIQDFGMTSLDRVLSVNVYPAQFTYNTPWYLNIPEEGFICKVGLTGADFYIWDRILEYNPKESEPFKGYHRSYNYAEPVNQCIEFY